MSDDNNHSDTQADEQKFASIQSLNDELSEIKSQKWSRVSPLAIFYFFVKTVYESVSSLFIYSLPAVAAGYSSIKENPEYVIVLISIIFLIILISSLTKYWFYLYKFTDNRLEIKQGVLKKSHLDLPFNKIQNVKIVQPIYYRPMKYAFIELDTAGSASQEAKIVALPLSLAESFKQMILEISHDKPIQEPLIRDTNQAINNEILLNKRSVVDLIIHGITNNRVWIFLGFLAPFYNTISEHIVDILNLVGLDIAAYLDYQSQSLALFLLHVISLVMVIMLVIVMFSVMGSIFVFYDYRLSRLGDRYIRRSGLFTKQEVSMRLSRIQVLVQQQDWLDMLFSRTNLRFEQNTSTPVNSAQAGDINNASKLIVPSVSSAESIALAQNAYDVESFQEINFSNISKRFIVRILLFRFLPIIGLFYALALVNNPSSIASHTITAFSILLAFLIVFLRWRRWGYHFSSQYVYIRKGFIGVNYYVFPIAKIQQVKFKQSIFMKANKLADIQYVLASGAYTIPLIPQSDAIRQADLGLLSIAKYKPAWM